MNVFYIYTLKFPKNRRGPILTTFCSRKPL